MKNYLKKRIEELEASNMLPQLKANVIKECEFHLRAWERIKAEEHYIKLVQAGRNTINKTYGNTI